MLSSCWNCKNTKRKIIKCQSCIAKEEERKLSQLEWERNNIDGIIKTLKHRCCENYSMEDNVDGSSDDRVDRELRSTLVKTIKLYPDFQEKFNVELSFIIQNYEDEYKALSKKLANKPIPKQASTIEQWMKQNNPHGYNDYDFHFSDT